MNENRIGGSGREDERRGENGMNEKQDRRGNGKEAKREEIG